VQKNKKVLPMLHLLNLVTRLQGKLILLNCPFTTSIDLLISPFSEGLQLVQIS
jgi:hypothetical protein